MQELDDSLDVFVRIAYDPGLLEVLPTLNETPEKDPKERERGCWKENCRWGWLNELPRHGKPHRVPLVEGLQGKPGSKGTAGSRL